MTTRALRVRTMWPTRADVRRTELSQIGASRVAADSRRGISRGKGIGHGENSTLVPADPAAADIRR